MNFCRHNIRNQPLSTTIPFQVNSATSQQQKHINISARFLQTFFFDFFQDSMALQKTRHKNSIFTHINTFFLFIINPRILSFSQIVFNLRPIYDPRQVGLPQQLPTPPTNYTINLLPTLSYRIQFPYYKLFSNKFILLIICLRILRRYKHCREYPYHEQVKLIQPGQI